MAVHRRLFPDDKPRLFTAVVDAFENGLLKATGSSWIPTKDGFTRKPETRTKILSLSSGSLILYQLPTETDLAELKIVVAKRKSLLTDGRNFSLDITESE